MRCFIAVNIPENLKREVEKIIRTLPDEGLIKVNSENLHFTLKFLGELSEKEVQELKTKLNEINSVRFSLSLKTVGFFPNENYLRVVWIGADEGRKEMVELQRLIEDKLDQENFRKEKESEPHLTIARVKFVKDKKGFIEKIRKTKFEWNFHVTEFSLMKSTLTPKGPVYEIISTFKLK